MESASGSGFVLDRDGHIVTNAHVVEYAWGISVVFQDESEVPAELIGINSLLDIAVIKVDLEPDRLIPISFGNSDDIAVGQSVLAIGNPYGLHGTLTDGIISGLDRDIEFSDGSTIEGMIQTNAALSPGNSGGPLINLEGEVIGINTARYRVDNLGFAIPSNTVLHIAQDLIFENHVDLSHIGITGNDVDSLVRNAKCLRSNLRGVIVTDVEPDSPAAASGLRKQSSKINGSWPTYRKKVFDIITAIDGLPIQGLLDLKDYLGDHTHPGQEVTLTVFQSREIINVVDIPIKLEPGKWFGKFTLEGRNTAIFSTYYGFSGIDNWQDRINVGVDDWPVNPGSVLVFTVEEGSAAAAAGLRGYSFSRNRVN